MKPDTERLKRYAAEHRDLFDELASGQAPHTLFIACADSRIVPELLTGTGPGELFVVRNVANIVPAYDPALLSSTAAGVEFAVAVLGVRHVVVCGHSNCGGIAALYDGIPPGTPHLGPWVELARAAVVHDPGDRAGAITASVQRNILQSLERLLTYPVVAERETAGELQLHGWYFDIAAPRVLVFDRERDLFA